MRALLILTAFGAMAASAAPQVHHQEQIDAALARAGLAARVPAFEKSRPDELAMRLDALLRDPASDPIVREKLLADGARALALAPRTPAAEALASRIAAVETEVFVWFDEGEHRARSVPAFAPAVVARNAFRHWARLETRDAAAAQLERGGLDPRRAYSDASADAVARAAGIADAIAAASTTAAGRAQLREALPRLSAALADGEPLEDALATAAAATASSEGFAALFATGDPDRTVHHLVRARRALAADDAVEVLAPLTRPAAAPELASAALLELGALAADDPAAEALLFARLGDRALGGSAAAALARADDPAIVARLAATARTAPDALTARRAALALHLDPSPDAQAALAGLADDPRVGRDARRWSGR